MHVCAHRYVHVVWPLCTYVCVQIHSERGEEGYMLITILNINPVYLVFESSSWLFG